MADDMVVKDGKLYGGWRQPVNIWMDVPGSIHNDAVAQGVGMRGGTIPGTVHLNLFGPLLVELWGKRWWEKGSISIYYTYATTHREDVRAIIVVPPKGAKTSRWKPAWRRLTGISWRREPWRSVNRKRSRMSAPSSLKTRRGKTCVFSPTSSRGWNLPRPMSS